jgi:hypothetical protein
MPELELLETGNPMPSSPRMFATTTHNIPTSFGGPLRGRPNERNMHPTSYLGVKQLTVDRRLLTSSPNSLAAARRVVRREVRETDANAGLGVLADGLSDWRPRTVTLECLSAAVTGIFASDFLECRCGFRIPPLGRSSIPSSAAIN